ncbi:MAG: hypothetical protein ACR2KW_01495 [Rubrobacter sp.]
MSDKRPKGFLSRVFGPVEDDHTSVYSSRDEDDDYTGEDDYADEADGESIEETGRSFTVERATEIIKHLPPEVPRSSAVRIVRQTLVAAGIDMNDLTRSTENREEKLSSEIELREGKIEDLRQRTDETVRDLERRIREAREDRDTGVAAEERRIATARDGLEDAERVRDFFDLQRGADPARPEMRGPLADNDYDDRADDRYQADDSLSEETQVIDRSSIENDDDTRIISRPEGLSDDRNARREGPGRNDY